MLQVWQDNLEEEMALIRDIVDDYPYLAMGEEIGSQKHSPYFSVERYGAAPLELWESNCFNCLHLLCRHGVSRHSCPSCGKLQKRRIPLSDAQVHYSPVIILK